MKKHRTGAGYTVPAAAEAIGVSYKVMRNAIDCGDIKAFRFGGLLRISPSEVERVKRMFDDNPPMPAETATGDPR